LVVNETGATLFVGYLIGCLRLDGLSGARLNVDLNLKTRTRRRLQTRVQISEGSVTEFVPDGYLDA
jgi:hypothetical protein